MLDHLLQTLGEAVAPWPRAKCTSWDTLFKAVQPSYKFNQPKGWAVYGTHATSTHTHTHKKIRCIILIWKYRNFIYRENIYFVKFCIIRNHYISLQCLLMIDSTIYETHKDLRELFLCVNSDLTLLDKWYKTNKLVINATKTKHILFS